MRLMRLPNNLTESKSWSIGKRYTGRRYIADHTGLSGGLLSLALLTSHLMQKRLEFADLLGGG